MDTVYIVMKPGMWEFSKESIIGVFKQEKDADDMVKSFKTPGYYYEEFDLIN